MSEPITDPDLPDDEPATADDEVQPPPDPYAERAARDQLLGPGDDPD